MEARASGHDPGSRPPEYLPDDGSHRDTRGFARALTGDIQAALEDFRAFVAGLAPGGVLHLALEAVGLAPPRRFRGLGAAWLVLSAFTYPYVLLPVSARLSTVPQSLHDSARLLGHSAWSTFVRVTLPHIRASVAASTLLVFLYTLSELGAAPEILRFGGGHHLDSPLLGSLLGPTQPA